MIRRTKIVCTIGPQTSSPERLQELVDTEMNAARLTLLHGSHDKYRTVTRTAHQLRDQHGSLIGIIADLSGPKIRLGEVLHGPILLKPGHAIADLSSHAHADTSCRCRYCPS